MIVSNIQVSTTSDQHQIASGLHLDHNFDPNFDPKFFFDPKIFWPEIFFWPIQFFDPKIFLTRKFFDPKNFLTKKIFWPEKFFVPKNFQKYFSPKFSSNQKTLFGQKYIFDQKIISTQQNFFNFKFFSYNFSNLKQLWLSLGQLSPNICKYCIYFCLNKNPDDRLNQCNS